VQPNHLRAALTAVGPTLNYEADIPTTTDHAGPFNTRHWAGWVSFVKNVPPGKTLNYPNPLEDP